MKCINVFEKAINPRHSLVYVLLLMIAVAMFAPMGVQAQSTRTIDVTITTKDINDAQKVTNYLCHLAPTRSSNGSQRAAAPACDVHSSALPTLAPTGGASSPPFFHPADMTYNGGPVVQSAQFTNFYLNSTCTPKQTCWGNPEGFMPDYFASEFIHIDNFCVHRLQTTKSNARGRI